MQCTSCCAGVVATACTQGRRTQHGKPDSVVGRGDQPETGDGQRGRYRVAERPVVLRKPGNAGGISNSIQHHLLQERCCLIQAEKGTVTKKDVSPMSPTLNGNQKLQSGAPRPKQRAKEVVIACIHHVIFVQVHPPAATEMPRRTRPEFCRQSVLARY